MAGLVTTSAAAQLWAAWCLGNRPSLLGTALLARVFGQRHPLDADHIATIDTVVRRLLADGGHAGTVALRFSLDRSTIVVLACVAVALGAGPAQMSRVGFLFGLGFDTATEGGLLAIAATRTASGLAPWSVLVFPALFAAGMPVVDTADSRLMVRAYGWAGVDPARKLLHNLTITGSAVNVALFIGGIKVLGEAFHLDNVPGAPSQRSTATLRHWALRWCCCSLPAGRRRWQSRAGRSPPRADRDRQPRGEF